MGYIFESEIVSIINTVRARTIGEEDSIKVKQALAADIHPAIKAYFKAEVEKLLAHERRHEVRSKRFPYGLPEVAGLQRQIDLLLVNNYDFGRSEFEILLDAAVHFQFNYLCRPQFTLQSFLFEGRRAIPGSELLKKFRYCVEYTYFGELVKRYVIERGLAEIRYEELRTLIERIDREIVAQHSGRELARMLKPMVEFVEVGIPGTHVSETGPVIPINAAIVFFEDKKLNDLQKRLEEERDVKNVTEISIEDLGTILAGVRGDQEAVEAAAPPKPEQTAVLEALVGEAPEVYPPAEKPGGRKTKEQAGKLDDIYALFTVKERKHLVKKLFNKDEMGFRNALDRLSRVVSWEEASLVLDEIFTANNVDPFSPAAVQMTDRIFGRYGQVAGNKS